MANKKPKNSREPRSASTRETETRRTPWTPPSMLETPPAHNGYQFRWLRAEMMGEADKTNMSKRFREGYVVVHPDDLPAGYQIPTLDDGKHAGVCGVGGLILGKIPVETANERRQYYRNVTAMQMDAIDNELMKDSNPAMPMGAPKRQKSVTFGNPENKPTSE